MIKFHFYDNCDTRRIIRRIIRHNAVEMLRWTNSLYDFLYLQTFDVDPFWKWSYWAASKWVTGSSWIHFSSKFGPHYLFRDLICSFRIIFLNSINICINNLSCRSWFIFDETWTKMGEIKCKKWFYGRNRWQKWTTLMNRLVSRMFEMIQKFSSE